MPLNLQRSPFEFCTFKIHARQIYVHFHVTMIDSSLLALERLRVLCAELEQFATTPSLDETTVDAAKSVERCCKEFYSCIETCSSAECLPQMTLALSLLHKVFLNPCCKGIAPSTGWVSPFYSIIERISIDDRQDLCAPYSGCFFYCVLCYHRHLLQNRNIINAIHF